MRAAVWLARLKLGWARARWMIQNALLRKAIAGISLRAARPSGTLRQNTLRPGRTSALPQLNELMTLHTPSPLSFHLLTRRLLATVCLCLAWGAQAQSAGRPQMSLERVNLTAGMYRIDAQLAKTVAQQKTGLMYRKELAQQEGMLFMFPQDGVHCFWMKNTLIPLTAAFVEEDGTIVNLADMQPQTTESHCSDKPVRFVLEMNQGWFQSRGIKPGFRLTGAVFSKPVQKR